MGSYEWMELQTLTDEIAASRARLAAARASRDVGRVRALEEEISAAEGRRDRLLAHITTNLVSNPEKSASAKAGAAPAAAGEVAPAGPPPEAVVAASAATDRARSDAGSEPSLAQPSGTTVAAPGAAPAAPAAQGASVEGDSMAWEQLTPADIDRAKHELGVRRAEMLARHAEELKGLEGDQAQLEALEQAIAAFAQKFAKPGVVKLDDARELRQQGA